ncbi:membrane dipeptidase [Amycolatopsis sp. NPDC005232]|uniref:membrane dipeptidase n=1 Tax=Amycolatopsis sp. NPDC005232 TaxID=3157027 RepID=UPI0033A71D4E
MLRAVAETGGVIGMSAAPHTILSHSHPLHDIHSVMDHFRYCADLVGIEHVAFGSDTLYGEHVGLHTVFGHLLGKTTGGGPPHEKVPDVDGLENPKENFGNISGELVRDGLSDSEIAPCCGTILRVLKEVGA